MFGLGVWELVLILIVLIFFYGSKRIPQLGQGIGQSVREFKEAYTRFAPKKEEEPPVEEMEKADPHAEEPLFLPKSSVRFLKENGASEVDDSRK
jgi:sec-independent protein translocase protein TatA